MGNEIDKRAPAVQRVPGDDPIGRVQVGDWYWITTEGWDKKEHRELWCVYHVGSNHFQFKRPDDHSSHTVRIHFDDFATECEREDNWRKIFQTQAEKIQRQIQQKTQELIEAGRALSLLPQAQQERPAEESMLPAVVTSSPVKYKKDLVRFRDKDMPAIQKEIEGLGKDLAVTFQLMAYTDLGKLEQVKGALAHVEERIFIVELYCGIQEEVHQIAQGDPALLDEPICLRQQMLYNDEETLFNYRAGGMDFGDIEEFDRCVVEPDNLSRILPEQRGIVAFRVRRKDKDYGPSKTLLQAWVRMRWRQEDMKTYILIRNGANVYRIATAIDFSPRLVPFRTEISEKNFIKVDRWKCEPPDKEPEFVTPDSVEFDDYANDQESLMRKYNRIFILLQGLLDRSEVFHPHVEIKLNSDEHLAKYFRLIRDEEDGLPNNQITFEAYGDRANRKIRAGDLVYSTWITEECDSALYDLRNSRGSWGRHGPTKMQEEIIGRPRVCRVATVKKDRSEVQIEWEQNYYFYGRGWAQRDEDRTRVRHLWVPMNEVFNVSAYKLGDYRMFLCDRALRGAYLKWAAPILTAEDIAQQAAKGEPYVCEKGREI